MSDPMDLTKRIAAAEAYGETVRDAPATGAYARQGRQYVQQLVFAWRMGVLDPKDRAPSGMAEIKKRTLAILRGEAS